MMKVAVLGAGGFVGGHALRFLQSHGIAVRGVVRRPPQVCGGAEYRLADMCDVYALRQAFRGCDHVVHAALGTNDEIVDCIAPVYAAAEAVGVKRLVYISTGSVHGQAPAPGTDENSPLSVQHVFPYNAAKVRAERKLQRLRRRGTVEIAILRPTIVFGPGSWWVYGFADALHSGTAYVVDGARGICNSIYVDNLSHAITLALTQPGIDGEAFLVGDAETVTWADLFRPIAEACGTDFDTVPSRHPPDPVLSLKSRYMTPLRSSETVRHLTRRVSPELKARAKTIVRVLRRRGAPPAHAPAAAGTHAVTAAQNPTPTVPPEVVLLQRCRWRLPHDKAVRVLGYEPPVSFAEGCRRSVEWLLERAAAKSAAS